MPPADFVSSAPMPLPLMPWFPLPVDLCMAVSFHISEHVKEPGSGGDSERDNSASEGQVAFQQWQAGDKDRPRGGTSCYRSQECSGRFLHGMKRIAPWSETAEAFTNVALSSETGGAPTLTRFVLRVLKQSHILGPSLLVSDCPSGCRAACNIKMSGTCWRLYHQDRRTFRHASRLPLSILSVSPAHVRLQVSPAFQVSRSRGVAITARSRSFTGSRAID
jgi:hypothetical protein